MNLINGGLIRINGSIRFLYTCSHPGHRPQRAFIVDYDNVLLPNGMAEGTQLEIHESQKVPYFVQHVFASCARLFRKCIICNTTCILHDTQHFVFGDVQLCMPRFDFTCFVTDTPKVVHLQKLCSRCFVSMILMFCAP